MTNNVMPSIVQIEAEELKKLVSEVKETVATGVLPVRNAKRKVFGVVDLWNVRRKMKTASVGRRAF
jgi:hypothetical protein